MTHPPRPPDPPLPDPRLMRRAPVRAALEELARVLHPEGPATIRGVRRLRGGISASMHAFDLHTSDGQRLPLVLRRYVPGGEATPMWETLALLERLGLPAPRRLWSDVAGNLFDVPALVMTRVLGHGDLAPRDPERLADEMAHAIAAVHCAPLTEGARGFLRRQADVSHDPFRISSARAERIAVYPDGAAVSATVARYHQQMERAERTLTHGDYWPGNVLFSRGRLTAIVDWDRAALLPPAIDVAGCRIDLSMLFGPEVADRFQRTYETVVGSPIEIPFAWDLLIASFFMPDPSPAVAGYPDLGRRDLSLDVIRMRFDAFVRRALARAGN